jgi:hypothetical protein
VSRWIGDEKISRGDTRFMVSPVRSGIRRVKDSKRRIGHRHKWPAYHESV